MSQRSPFAPRTALARKSTRLVVIIGVGTVLSVYAVMALVAVELWVKRGDDPVDGFPVPQFLRLPAVGVAEIPPLPQAPAAIEATHGEAPVEGAEPPRVEELAPEFLRQAAGLVAAPPRAQGAVVPLAFADLEGAPEVSLQDAVPSSSAGEIASAIAKINSLNEGEPDGFIKSLVRKRVDLAGLPFVLGDACRKTDKESRAFARAATDVHRSRLLGHGWGGTGVGGTTFIHGSRGDPADEPAKKARVAALMQILAPAPEHLRTGLAENLAGVSNTDATRALARLAVFSMEEEVRAAAIEGLKTRREKDYTDIILGGLCYPWPTVAKHAAEVIAKVRRTDLIPQLVAVLEKPDPRLAAITKVGDKSTLVLRELVRVNHHRNCLLCHAPAQRQSTPRGVLTAAVPIPGKPLPLSLMYYADRDSDTLVRVDITYLRQDFSLLQSVANAAPWPEMQRFDFFVRTRTVTNEEARAHRLKLSGRSGGVPNPYRESAVAALRALTGRDTGPTAPAWRRLPDLPDKTKS
jgi:hypothetical protein